MNFFTGKNREKVNDPRQAEGQTLVTKSDYSVEPITVISQSNDMIVRAKVCFPYADNPNIELIAKDLEGNPISSKCVFMGKGKSDTEVRETPVFQEIVFSVFVSYLQEDCVFCVTDKKADQVIHEQRISKDCIENLRASMDSVLFKNAANDPYYNEWFKKHKATQTELEMQRNAKLDIEPKFSIVVPLYKTPINLLDELVKSILSQSYPKWELLLVNASPENDALRASVKSFCEQDTRIIQIKLDDNEGITLNTAHGIDAATGDFVCFMDHDDLLEPNCLFEYANAVNEKPQVELIYCDEDLLKQDGSLSNVNFKPEFSLHLLRNVNNLCHMLCIKKDLLSRLNYRQKEFDGAQDHHLTLQAIENTRRIAHIPKVLYHWREVETSVAVNADAKPYAGQKVVDAVSAHLKRQGIKAEVFKDENIPFTAKIIYDVPENKPLVSIIVPTHDSCQLLKRCVNSILKKTTYENYEIVLVENNSKDKETFEYYKTLESNPRINIVERNTPANVADYNNFGRKHSRGDYLVLLNNDTEVITPNWLETMLGLCSQSEVGIVGCKLLYPDDTIQHAGVIFGNEPLHYFVNQPNHSFSYLNYQDRQREVSAVTSACLMTKASVYDEVEGFDENLKFGYNDIDFSLKVKELGHLIIYTPYVELYHYESASRPAGLNVDALTEFFFAKAYLQMKWPKVFAGPDEYATPNLRQDAPCAYFSL